MDAPPTPPAKDRRLLLAGLGATVALAAGLGAAWMLASCGGEGAPPPASQGGLVIEANGEDGHIDPARPLRCFVEGRFVGEFSLADCARRNGVATDALDVGIDQTGALAASQQAGTELTPLPPPQAKPEAEAPPPAEATPATPEAPPGHTPAACWRYAGGQWRRLPSDLDLSACVQTLFAGRCERPGRATYGRWGAQTLRLVTGKIEVSGDNQTFRTLTPQGPGCAIQPLG